LKCSQCRCLKRNWNTHKWRCTHASKKKPNLTKNWKCLW
jgi:hypothetical protein